MKRLSVVILALIFLVSFAMPATAASMPGHRTENTYGSFDKDDSTKVGELFAKWYTNEIIVVRTDKLCAYGQPTGAVGTFDLSKLNTQTLMFYDYDIIENKINLIKQPNYKIGTDGKLTFYTTANLGYVIITDQKLSKDAVSFDGTTTTAPAASSASVNFLSEGTADSIKPYGEGLGFWCSHYPAPNSSYVIMFYPEDDGNTARMVSFRLYADKGYWYYQRFATMAGNTYEMGYVYNLDEMKAVLDRQYAAIHEQPK